MSKARGDMKAMMKMTAMMRNEETKPTVECTIGLPEHTKIKLMMIHSKN